MYVSLARGIVETGGFNHTDTPEKPSADRLPFYSSFLAAVFLLFGESLLVVVAVQILLDSMSCVFVYMFAEAVAKGIGVWSGVLAALSVGMITYAHFILNDSLFVFFFLLLLLSGVRFLSDGDWKWSAITGLASGVIVFVRPVAIYLPFFMGPLLFAYMLLKHNAHWLAWTVKIMLLWACFLLALSPWAFRNYSHYGRLQMSTQSGEHLLQYIVPFVWQYSRGIPFIEGMKKTSDEFHRRATEAGLEIEKANPFEVSDFQVSMAVDYLRSEPKSAILKAWIFGAAKNLFSPAIVDFSYLLQVERPHFFYTEGKTTLERAWNFVAKTKGWFGWALIANLVLLFAARVVQLWGLIQMMRTKPWAALFLVSIVGYFLLVSGPVGYAKYRLPFEPILIIFLATGMKDLYERYRRSRTTGTLQYA